jgi:hypothetical protein
MFEDEECHRRRIWSWHWAGVGAGGSLTPVLWWSPFVLRAGTRTKRADADQEPRAPGFPASQPFAPGRLAPLQSWADGDGGGADRIPIRVTAAFAGKTPIE